MGACGRLQWTGEEFACRPGAGVVDNVRVYVCVFGCKMGQGQEGCIVLFVGNQGSRDLQPLASRTLVALRRIKHPIYDEPPVPWYYAPVWRVLSFVPWLRHSKEERRKARKKACITYTGTAVKKKDCSDVRYDGFMQGIMVAQRTPRKP